MKASWGSKQEMRVLKDSSDLFGTKIKIEKETDFKQPLNFELLNEVKESNQRCEEHDCEMIVFRNLNPFCQQCAKEQLELKEGNMTRAAMAKHYKRTTYDCLRNLSIYSDESLNGATFKSYEAETNETKLNKKAARLITKDYIDGASFNTMFFGSVGVGKSHLSMAMLEAINETSNPFKKCLFVSSDELMRRIKDSFNNKDSIYTEQNMVSRLIDADILVLDDIGAETGGAATNKAASDYTIKTLNAVVNGRMDKPTVFTTNLSSKQLTAMYDARLVSRILRGTKGHVIKFVETVDRRTEIDYGF